MFHGDRTLCDGRANRGGAACFILQSSAPEDIAPQVLHGRLDAGDRLADGVRREAGVEASTGVGDHFVEQVVALHGVELGERLGVGVEHGVAVLVIDVVEGVGQYFARVIAEAVDGHKRLLAKSRSQYYTPVARVLLKPRPTRPG